MSRKRYTPLHPGTDYQHVARSRGQALKDLEKENGRLRKAISDLTLDKLILKEALEGNC